MSQYKQLLSELETVGELVNSINSKNVREIKTYSDYTYFDGPIKIILKSGAELYVDYYTDDRNCCKVTRVKYKDILIILNKLIESERMLLEDKVISLFNRIKDRFPNA